MIPDSENNQTNQQSTSKFNPLRTRQYAMLAGAFLLFLAAIITLSMYATPNALHAEIAASLLLGSMTLLIKSVNED